MPKDKSAQIKDFYQENTCCMIGHRQIPDSLRGFIIHRMFYTIEAAMNKGYRTFLCDGERGFGSLAARVVLYFRQTSVDRIRLILCLPRFRQEKYWPEDEKKTYRHILRQADQVLRLPNNLGRRHRWMIDHSSRCIQYMEEYRGPSHSAQACLYAISRRLDIPDNLHDDVLLWQAYMSQYMENIRSGTCQTPAL